MIRTDISLIKKGRRNTAPASLNFCQENKSVWLRLNYQDNTQDVYNVDVDTSIGEENG